MNTKDYLSINSSGIIINYITTNDPNIIPPDGCEFVDITELANKDEIKKNMNDYKFKDKVISKKVK